MMTTYRALEVVAESSRELGRRLMMATAPLAQTVIGIPLAAATFTAGWVLQFAGRSPQTHAESGADRREELDEATAELLG